MTCKVNLTPGRVHFHIGDVSFFRVVSPALVKLVKVESYNKNLSAVRLLVEFLDGSRYVEQFSLREELGLLNYPNYIKICKSVDGVVIE